MEDLEKLAQDPNYKMTPEQLEELEKIRPGKYVRHNPAIPKHDTRVPKHNVEMEKEDGQAHRDTPQQSGH
jgi:hypothetical protein